MVSTRSTLSFTLHCIRQVGCSFDSGTGHIKTKWLVNVAWHFFAIFYGFFGSLDVLCCISWQFRSSIRKKLSHFESCELYLSSVWSRARFLPFVALHLAIFYISAAVIYILRKKNKWPEHTGQSPQVLPKIAMPGFRRHRGGWYISFMKFQQFELLYPGLAIQKRYLSNFMSFSFKLDVSRFKLITTLRATLGDENGENGSICWKA